MVNNLSQQPKSLQSALVVKDLSKSYVRGGFWRRRFPVFAVKNVNFEISRGNTLALVGESGSGKSTLARCIARLEMADFGQLQIPDEAVVDLALRSPTSWHREVQMVFQDAATSMNPRFTLAQVVEEPLLISGSPMPARREAVRKAMAEVGLSTDSMSRSFSELSGGQRQRLALARALVVRPKLLILDEAFAGLDPSTQAQIANLLFALQATHSLTYLLISHDLGLVSRMADQVAVIWQGQIVEIGPTCEIMTSPRHGQTIRLLTAAKQALQNLAAARGTLA